MAEERNYITEFRKRSCCTLSGAWDPSLTQEGAKEIMEWEDKVVLESIKESAIKYFLERGFKMIRDPSSERVPFYVGVTDEFVYLAGDPAEVKVTHKNDPREIAEIIVSISDVCENLLRFTGLSSLPIHVESGNPEALENALNKYMAELREQYQE